MIARRIDPADLSRELAAQIVAVQEEAGKPTHVNTHQHLHLWPPMREVVLQLARDHQIRAISVPRSNRLTPTGLGVRKLSRSLQRRAAMLGLAHPDDFVGLDEAGAMGPSRLARSVDRLARRGAATAELRTHPGHPGDTQRYRWGYHWADELAALTDRRVGRLVAARGFELGTFSSLVARSQESVR
jgi:predicted glycoside hydrolase/deacetylase ChbG (UPF0249 family)